MMVLFNPAEPCKLCHTPLRSYFINVDEAIYMCPNQKCCYPLMTEDVSQFIVSQVPEISNNALDELSQDPFFAEMFSAMSSISNSRPVSRESPSYSALSLSSENDEEFTNMSLINSAAISLLCINAVSDARSRLETTAIGSVLTELADAHLPHSTSADAVKALQFLSEKIVFFRPNDTSLSIALRLNQLINRILTDAPALRSHFLVETSSSATCTLCGSSSVSTSASCSIQLKSFTAHENCSTFSSVESCSECDQMTKNVSVKVVKSSDVLVICCQDKASQAISALGPMPLTDFERVENGKLAKYALTSVVKYDEHVRRMIVAVRRSSGSGISDVNNWLRFDSLESFLAGRFTNPPDVAWLTSLPLLFVWQRVDEKPWCLSNLPFISALNPVTANGPTTPAFANGTSAFLNVSSPCCRVSSRNSTVSGTSGFAKLCLEKKFVLTPPSRAASSHVVPIHRIGSTHASNSQFLTKSLERLSAHRRTLEGKFINMKANSHSGRTGSNVSSNDSFVSPRSSNGSEAKRSRLESYLEYSCSPVTLNR